MLREILSPQTCAACRLCCGFDRTDLWELPVLPPETVAVVQRLNDKTAMTDKNGEAVFAAPDLHDDELFSCPMLCQTGCTMGAEKPFDCQVWPFRLMQDKEDAVRITVADYCPGIKSYSLEQLRDFLRKGLAQKMLDYAQQHPAHVHPMMEGYRIVL